MNARLGLWMTALAISPLMFAACSDDDDDDSGTGGNAGEATGGGSGDAGAGQGGTTQGGRGGSAGSGMVGGTGGTMGGEGGDGGMGGGDGPADPGGRAINMTPTRFFPEGVAVDRNGNFYLGSMYLGLIHKANAESEESEPFIHAGENDLVSVLGIYAEDGDGTDANPGTLWVCSSDAGNSSRSGTAPVALKAFNLMTGEATGSWDWPEPSAEDPDAPEGIFGFCNDITIDAQGNVYATDSWYPRILRLPKANRATAELEVWIEDETFGADKWHLNGIDIDQSNNTLYVVENHPGTLWSIPIEADGSAGEITEIETSEALGGPDGLKVVAPNLLATAESNGVSLIAIDGDQGEVTKVFHGFDGVATIALHQASVWIVENQGDHFWEPANAGPDATPPFRLVEVPIDVGAGAGIINTNEEQFFSEGVTVDEDGNLYVGSMQHGSIHRAASTDASTEEFIAPGAGELVSVLGLYAHSASNTLWVCSSDTDASEDAPDGPTTLKSFTLDEGEAVGSWAWPAPAAPLTGPTANGFCNDITIDPMGRIYATDSWYPRIVRLPANPTDSDVLTTWVTDVAFPPTQWHLNGLDVDPAGENLYVVENHPGTLWRIPIMADGSAGTVTEIVTSRPLRGPDGLKVVNPTTLAVAEGSGMAIIELTGDTGLVRTINTGLDGIATFALLGSSAWLVENQGDHYWGSTGPQGPTAELPFRLIEVPLGVE
jgi:sugar lactone lactonase YvrE